MMRLAGGLVILVLVSLFLSSFYMGSLAVEFSASAMSSFEWSQFHGSETHAGYSPCDGPTRPVVAWQYSLGGSVDGLIVKDNVLIASNPTAPKLVAISESNGSVLFDYQIDTHGEYWNSIASYPAAGGGLVYFTFQGSSYISATSCVNSNFLSGSPAWSLPTPSGSSSSYYGTGLVTYYQGIVYSSPFNGKTLTAILATSGRQLWQVQLFGKIDTIPTIGDGILVVGYSDTYNVTAISANTGEALWNFTADSSVVASPAYSEGHFFFGTLGGNVYSLLTSGEVEWSTDLGAPVESTPALAFGLVFLGTDDGHIYALNATSGTIVWEYSTGGGLVSSPAVSGNGILYEGDSNGIFHALNATTGSKAWQYDLGSRIISSPALDNGYLFIVDTQGQIYAFSSVVWDVAFEETGLPSQIEWSVTLNNVEKTSVNNTITFTMSEGTYSFAVGNVTGYAANPTSGQITLKGKNVKVPISFAIGWTLPSAPQNLKATGSVGSIALTWAAPSDSGAPPDFTGSGIETYYIFRSTAPNEEQYYDKVGGSTLTYTDGSVNPNAIYFYKITTANPIGQSGFSNEAGAMAVFYAVPSPPLNMTALAQGNTIFLAWNPPASNGGTQITEYVLYRGIGPESMEIYTTLLGNTTHYEDTSFAPAQTYHYKVIAVNNVGQSNPSNTAITTAPKSLGNANWWRDPSDSRFWDLWGLVLGVPSAIAASVAIWRLVFKDRRKENRRLAKQA